MTDDRVRGLCPRCGDAQVIHHELGMPLPEAVSSAPPWVRWAGCTGLGPDRECSACDFTWWAADHGHLGEEDLDEGELAPVRVVGAVIVDGDRVLAARRGPGRSAAGRWEFPGGKIEAGESPQQALARELREELDVEVEVGWLIGRGEGFAGLRELQLDCYWARLRGPAPRESTDHDALEWVRRDQLAQRPWAEPDLPVLALLLEGAEPTFSQP